MAILMELNIRLTQLVVETTSGQKWNGVNDTHVTTKPNVGHYTCTIPWKGEGPNLVNNINEVLARQRRTNSSNYLVKKGTSLKEIDEKYQDQITKGYIEKIDLKKEDIYRKDSYFLSYFPVVNRNQRYLQSQNCI